MEQSKFEVITCSWRKARENACERVTIGFGFTSDWMKKWRESFKTITYYSNRKTNYFSTLKWKPLYVLAVYANCFPEVSCKLHFSLFGKGAQHNESPSTCWIRPWRRKAVKIGSCLGLRKAGQNWFAAPQNCVLVSYSEVLKMLRSISQQKEVVKLLNNTALDLHCNSHPAAQRLGIQHIKAILKYCK